MRLRCWCCRWFKFTPPKLTKHVGIELRSQLYELKQLLCMRVLMLVLVCAASNNLANSAHRLSSLAAAICHLPRATTSAAFKIPRPC